MWNCPVCDRKNDTPFCPVCGFDPSADAEAAPTFAPLTGAVPSAAGLRRDGTVCTTSDSNIYPMAEGWTNIIAIAAGAEHLVGLRTDGALVSVGVNGDSQCSVDSLML